MPIAQCRLEVLQVCKLLQCVRDKEKDQIMKLVDNGCPQLINYNDSISGDTALNIDLGAHPDVMDFKGRSAVMRAAEYGHVESMERLTKAGADMKLRDLEGRGILYYCFMASSSRHKRCLEFAIEYGADVNNKSVKNRHIMVDACEHAHDSEDLCLKLLEMGGDANGYDEESGRTALMAACDTGSSKVVHALLEAGADVNAIMKNGTTAAHEAAKRGHLEVLFELAAYGAMFDQYDDKGNNPVHYASLGHAPCVKFLSTRGCNPKPKNKDGFTARQLAKDNGVKDCLKEIKKQEKAFGKTGKDNDPWAIQLYDFCCARTEKLLDLFKKLDADAIGKVTREDFVDLLSSTDAPLTEDALKCLMLVFDSDRKGLIDYADFLTGKKYVNKNYLQTAMKPKEKKSKKGKGKKAGKFKMLMPICTVPEGPRTDNGGPPAPFIPKHIHFTDRDRFTRDNPPSHPLHDDSAWYLQMPDKSYVNITDASKNGDIDSLKLAFSKGYEVDSRDKFFKTPLMVACAYGNLETVKFLLGLGADVNATDNFNWTPMHHACHCGMLDIVRLLVDAGANINCSSTNMATPLMRAIESSRLEVVEYLISIGAKMQVTNRKGYTPLDVSVQWADPRVYQVVKAKFDTLPPPSDKKGAKKKAPAKPKKSAESPAAGDGRKSGEGNEPTNDENRTNRLPPVGPVSAADEVKKERRGSILRAASALAGGIDDKEDITYVPRKMWTKQMRTDELIRAKHQRSERFGWEVDFPHYQMPFVKNVTKRADVQGGAEPD